MKDQETKKSSEKKEVRGDSGIDQVVKDMPPPAPEVVHSERSRIGKEGSVDKYGRGFDPELHISNPDGTPKINKKNGRLCLKPGPQKKEEINKKIVDRGSDQGSKDESGALDSRLAAEVSVDTVSQIGVMCFGDEWRFQKTEAYDERENLVIATDRYYQVKGVRDIPPGVALTVAAMGYALRRLQSKNTRSKFGSMMNWTKKKIFGFGKMFRKGKAEDGAHVDSGSNGVGKNDTGNKASGEVQEEPGSGSGS